MLVVKEFFSDKMIKCTPKQNKIKVLMQTVSRQSFHDNQMYRKYKKICIAISEKAIRTYSSQLCNFTKRKMLCK